MSVALDRWVALVRSDPARATEQLLANAQSCSELRAEDPDAFHAWLASSAAGTKDFVYLVMRIAEDPDAFHAWLDGGAKGLPEPPRAPDPMVETCQECGKPVTGGRADPIVRVDGRPFHRKPCYNTAWRRKKRSVHQVGGN